MAMLFRKYRKWIEAGKFPYIMSKFSCFSAPPAYTLPYYFYYFHVLKLDLYTVPYPN